MLTEGWPEVLRGEIQQLNLSEAHVALPVRFVEPALKQGKVCFTWKVLRSWIRPATLPTVSAHDGMMLELPLRVIAPLFLARNKQHAAPAQKVEVDENIPNLFFGFPQGESAAAALEQQQAAPAESAIAEQEEANFAPTTKSANSVDTNFYVWNESTDAPQVDASAEKKASPGTNFLSRYATPNEVVSRAAALDGVAGALVALPDGLMVASKLSADLNGDTLAAFLPHIFGKVSQCTKELRMGELNNLHFTVGNVPWKIFRVNAIFFAAFGHAGKPLPTAQLAALAGELDRRK
jgi:predicted regulator of Ras-like GTPase activity (Roadblock/LC7/MglB family)